MADLPSEKVQQLLKTVVEHFDKEDRSARERQLRVARRLKLLWEGFSRVWYSDVAHDWKVWEEDLQGSSTDQAYYDKPINILRAYLESIVAALSINIPGVKCYPEDADNPLDISTARTGDKIAVQIYRHNDAPMLWLHALFIMCTEPMMACYSYPKSSEEYGTYEVKKYKSVKGEAYFCPNCNAKLDENLVDEARSTESAVMCPSCEKQIPVGLQKMSYTDQEYTSTDILPKTRVCMECYGALYVKIPNYAMKQKDIPYLIFSYETHYTNVVERYPHLRDEFVGNSTISKSSGGTWDPYERWARLSPQYRGEFPLNNLTCRNTWLRPSAFNVLKEEDCEELKDLYPNGVKVVMANDQFCEACAEELDKHWTILYDPLSDYLQKQPIGSLLVNVQDITNEIISLTLQTMEHGITQTFADSEVLNFDAYRQTEAGPGYVYPIKVRTGKTAAEAFHETKTASLSAEVMPFFESIQTLGQGVSGAQPSLWGGQLSGSRTASEYSMSRAQALQRLQNVWKMLLIWWKTVYSKAIPMYIDEIRDDERSVERDDQNNFYNVFIRKSDLEGKIGRIELEANENLPMTWAQRKDIYMELINSQNEHILNAISSPENIRHFADSIGLENFTVPGEDDRQKQLEEIRELVNSEPLSFPPSDQEVLSAIEMGQPPPEAVEVPSVPIDPDLDNHDIEAGVCRAFLVSEAGRLMRIENPVGYRNILLHMKAHMEQIKLSLMEQQMQQMSANNQQQGKPEGTSTPLAENQNVTTES